MFAEKFNFINEKINKKMALLCQENNNLRLAFSSIVSLYPECTIKDIKVIGDEYLISVISSASEKEVIVNKDGIVSNITYIEKDKERYENNFRRVYSKRQSDNVIEYEFIDDNKGLDYLIKLVTFKDLVLGNIIGELLDENRSIEDIKDIYYAIENCIDLENVSLKIKSGDGESFLEIINGRVIKYQSITKDSLHIVREYLHTDGKYYIDEIKSREISDEYHPFVKLKVR